MSDHAAAYQQQITGSSAASYYVNGVKFDGYDSVTGLRDAKGEGYAQWVVNGDFKVYFKGSDELLEQAFRQVRAAGDIPITWYIAEESAAKAIRNLLSVSNLDKRIIVVWMAPSK